MRNLISTLKRERRMKPWIVPLMVLVLAPLAPSGSSQALQFVVKEVGPQDAIVAADCRCAPGTLVGFTVASGQDFFLKIKKKIGDGLFRAVPAVTPSELRVLVAGAKGYTDSPLESYMPISVGANKAFGLVAGSAVLGVVPVVDPNVQTPDILVGAGAASNTEIQDILGKSSATNSVLYDMLQREADALQLFRLANSFYPAHIPGSTRSALVLLNKPDTGDGQLLVGKSINLSITPRLGGYCALLMFHGGGKITVLYPNAESDPRVKLLPSSTSLFSRSMEGGVIRDGIANIDLDALSPGPTAFIAIVSNVERPLNAFIRNGNHLSFENLYGHPLDPEQTGPGLWHSLPAGNRELSVDEMEPDTWDTASLIVEVAK